MSDQPERLAEQYADKFSDRGDPFDDWCVRHNCFLDGYRSRDTEVADYKDDLLRIHNEKVDHFEARIAAGRELAAARAEIAALRQALADTSRLLDVSIPPPYASITAMKQVESNRKLLADSSWSGDAVPGTDGKSKTEA